MNSVEVIFRDYILKGHTESENENKYFSLLMNYYSALEELSFPIVGSFTQEFVKMGFKTLPRR